MFEKIGEKLLIGTLTALVTILTMNHNDKKMEAAINKSMNKATETEETDNEENEEA